MDFYIDMTEYSREDRQHVLDRLSQEPHVPAVLCQENFLESVYWVFRRMGGRYAVFYSDREEPPRNAVTLAEARHLRETG